MTTLLDLIAEQMEKENNNREARSFSILKLYADSTEDERELLDSLLIKLSSWRLSDYTKRLNR